MAVIRQLGGAILLFSAWPACDPALLLGAALMWWGREKGSSLTLEP
jgi:hypothetical protein